MKARRNHVRDVNAGNVRQRGRAEDREVAPRIARSVVRLSRLIFAHGNPVRYRTKKPDPAAELLHYATVALVDFDGAAAERLALQAWAITHGLAMLMLDNRWSPTTR